MTHSSRILLGTLGLVWFGTPPFVARSAMEHNSFADEGNRSPSAVVTATDVQKPTVLAGPLSVDNARKSFLLASSDIKIELVVSEPDVIDPVAIAFGADLVMWVAEMRDLPLGPKHGSNGRPRSRIKRLFDLNRDGRYESVTVFADELLFVTGLTPWRDGVIVTQAGEISFLADRNGDGKADFKESWFSGFLGVNPQQLVSHPTLGPDGWIYVASGHCGGIVVATKPEWKLRGQQVPIEGFDFRFNPLSGEYGVASGNGQFGLCFDDFGNRFVCSNRNPVQHVVLENEVIKRNPFLPVQTTIQDVAAFVNMRPPRCSSMFISRRPAVFRFIVEMHCRRNTRGTHLLVSRRRISCIGKSWLRRDQHSSAILASTGKNFWHRRTVGSGR